MKLKVQIPIKAKKENIWRVISNIEDSAKIISGIKKIEIHHKPKNGLVGLKWTEKRVLFGKTATETMWIIESKDNKYYKTRAESHGSIYTSSLNIIEQDEDIILAMEFEGKAQTLGTKILSFIFLPFFKNATKKALYKDLVDIKDFLEQ